MRVAFASIVWNTGVSSPGELEMTRSTSEVAVCCSNASDSSRVRISSFFSRSRACALSFVIKVTRALSDGVTRVFALVPIERSLRARVPLFAPLRDKVTSSAQSVVPFRSGGPQPQGWRPSILTEPYRELATL